MLVVTGSKHGCSFITRPGGSRIEVSTLGFLGGFGGSIKGLCACITACQK